MKKIVLICAIAVFSLITFVKTTEAQNKGYILPKFTFNYPVKGGNMSFGFGGHIGYYIKPMIAVETGYLRIIGTGEAPDNHFLEVNTVLAHPFQKIQLFIQVGSGMYRITRWDIDSGWTGLMNFGTGIGLNFIPSMNMRIAFVYYSLFAHKDLFTGQVSLILSF